MLDLKEEKQYDQLRRLGQRLHIPIPETFWTLEVFDKDGKLLQKHHQRSHSLVRNAYNMLFTHLAGKDADDAGLYEAGKLSYKDTGAVIKADAGAGWMDASDDVDGDGYGYRAPGGSDTCGIIVGSGTNAESFEDIFLQTQLTDGSGAGEIHHSTTDPHVISYASLVMKNTLIRYFNNNTGGSRDINEVGLVNRGRDPSGFADKYFLAARDKLGATVTVLDTGQCKVTCTIQLTYPV